MSKFKLAFAITIAHERGYVNDALDAGGETYNGISRRFHGDWDGWPIVDELKTIPSHEQAAYKKLAETLEPIVEAFYKAMFWDNMSLDHLTDQAIANELFDTGVNQGFVAAAKYFQDAINLTNHYEGLINLSVDGDIGTKTLAAFKKHKRKANILKTMNILQGMLYITLARRKPSQKKFFNGWLNRVEV